VCGAIQDGKLIIGILKPRRKPGLNLLLFETYNKTTVHRSRVDPCGCKRA